MSDLYLSSTFGLPIAEAMYSLRDMLSSTIPDVEFCYEDKDLVPPHYTLLGEYTRASGRKSALPSMDEIAALHLECSVDQGAYSLSGKICFGGECTQFFHENLSAALTEVELRIEAKGAAERYCEFLPQFYDKIADFLQALPNRSAERKN